MGLVLRKNTTEPLTHNQLDGNFEYLQMTEWVFQNYEKGKVVYILDYEHNVLTAYLCVNTHNTLLYKDNIFRTTDDDGKVYWMLLSNGQTGHTIDNIFLLEDKLTLRVVYENSTYLDVKLSESYSSGITAHQFLKITTSDYGLSNNIVTLGYIGTLAMTDNIIVVDLTDVTYNENYFMELPNGDNNTAGARVKIFLKSFDLLDKKFYIKSNNVGEQNRILGRNLETYVTGVGYLLPLNPLEIADLIWDGNDWLVTNYIKEEYVSALAEPSTL